MRIFVENKSKTQTTKGGLCHAVKQSAHINFRTHKMTPFMRDEFGYIY